MGRWRWGAENDVARVVKRRFPSGMTKQRDLAAGEAVVEERGDDEGEKDGEDKASDDGDGEGLEHLRAGTDGKSERQHSGDGREGGHGDGPEATAASLQHGVFR